MQPKPDPWHDAHEKKFQALLNSIRDAEDEDVDGDGASTLLRDSLGRQVADVAGAIEDNDPAELADAVRKQTEAITGAGRRIADSQHDAAEAIKAAIEGHADIVGSAASAQPAATAPVPAPSGGTYTDRAVFLFAIAIGSGAGFDRENQWGRWFIDRQITNVFEVADPTPTNFTRKLGKTDEAPFPIPDMTDLDWKSFQQLARQVANILRELNA